MRVDPVHFPDRALQVREVAELVVAVRMVRPARDAGEDREDGGGGREPETHHRTLGGGGKPLAYTDS